MPGCGRGAGAAFRKRAPLWGRRRSRFGRFPCARPERNEPPARSDAGSDGDPRPRIDGNAYAGACCDKHAGAHANPDTDARPHAEPGTHRGAHAQSDADSDCFAEADDDADGDGYAIVWPGRFDPAVSDLGARHRQRGKCDVYGDASGLQRTVHSHAAGVFPEHRRHRDERGLRQRDHGVASGAACSDRGELLGHRYRRSGQIGDRYHHARRDRRRHRYGAARKAAGKVVPVTIGSGLAGRAGRLQLSADPC